MTPSTLDIVTTSNMIPLLFEAHIPLVTPFR